jgi:hypothetical protein
MVATRRPPIAPANPAITGAGESPRECARVTAKSQPSQLRWRTIGAWRAPMSCGLGQGDTNLVEQGNEAAEVVTRLHLRLDHEEIEVTLGLSVAATSRPHPRRRKILYPDLRAA